MSETLSFGGGVNTVALAIHLINNGWQGPIVFSDTGCEWPETYCYMDYFESSWLEPKGFSITRLKGLPWQQHGGSRGVKGCSLIEYCEVAKVIPLAAVRWCTTEWKVNPINRWKEVHRFDVSLIGIAADEAHRIPDAKRPLVENNITRKGCIEIIQGEGLDVPQKSGCYICPFQGVNQWRELWKRHPDLFERAARLEENAQRSAKSKRWNATLDPKGRHTLRQLEMGFNSQIVLPTFDMDELLAYKPCICNL